MAFAFRSHLNPKQPCGAEDALRPGGSRPASRLAMALQLLALSFFLTGCELIDQTLGAMFAISVEEEMEMGREFKKQIEAEMTLVNDPEIVNYVRSIGERIVSYSPYTAEVPLEFFVVDDPAINAFAIPGGYLYVNTGLIYASGDEAELASVIGHEFGHAVRRHGAEQMSREIGTRWGVDFVEQMVLGTTENVWVDVVSSLGTQAVIFPKFSREAELEADEVAVDTLYSAGYDPDAMISIFETLASESGGGDPGMLSFINSHPPTSERIQRAQTRISTFPAGGNNERPRNNLRQIQNRLRALGLVGGR